METTQLKINGMQCEACVSHVSKALEAVPGVHDVAVNLSQGIAAVQHRHADENRMHEAVRAAGYEAQRV